MSATPTKLFVCALMAFMIAGCTRNMNSSTYTAGSSGGVVLKGTVVSARPITIKNSDKLGDNGTGALAGAAVGGVGGSAVGKSSGNAAAVVGGAIAGAVAGALIQDALSTQEGMEYIVKIDKEYESGEKKTKKRSDITHNRASVQDNVQGSIDLQEMRTSMLSVIQGKDVLFQKGDRVYVIYSDDRPRLTPAD